MFHFGMSFFIASFGFKGDLIFKAMQMQQEVSGLLLLLILLLLKVGVSRKNLEDKEEEAEE